MLNNLSFEKKKNFNILSWKDQTHVSLARRYGREKLFCGFESLKSAVSFLKLFGVFAMVDVDIE